MAGLDPVTMSNIQSCLKKNLITYETAILHCPGRSVLPESLKEDLEHHDEEGGEESVVDDIEQGDLS